MKTKPLFISLTLGLGLTMALLWLLCHSTTPVIAAPAERPLSDATPFHYVAATGTDSGDCSTPASACLTIQYAVDQAGTDDEIRVASGVYTGTATQVVVITKSITIRGGYTTTNDFADPPDLAANPTTLDAEGQRRVLYVTGDISPTIEGLHLTGGDATGLGGGTGGANAGGGVYVITATATLRDNQVFSNTASSGGGLYLDHSAATLSGNTVVSNTADQGGGLYLYDSDATLSSNTIRDNTAGSGGGLYLDSSDATLSANTITANMANGTNWWNGGGGLYLYYSAAMLTNTVVADNQADAAGSGLCIMASSPRLLHTTIARNSGGDGSGIYATDRLGNYSSVALTNTILVSHTVGITVTAGNAATLESTLWGSGAWANGADTGGAGTIYIGTNNYTGDPAFADPDGGNYHIGLGSAAMDQGVGAGVTADMDGESRPNGVDYDLGADEFWATLEVTKEAYPDPVHSGAQLTYTIHVTNTGYIDLNATITDTLPAHVTPPDPRVWTEVITPGNTWTEQFNVTVETGYAGTLTNVVQVTTEEGATGVYTETSTSVICFARLNDEPTLYTTIQAAVDASTQPTDVVKVAGYCSAINTYGGLAQVAYISKTLTVRGGYTTTNWTTSDLVANPTTLDAQGRGRALFITGEISPTIESLLITGGNADGLGGGPGGVEDAGGGVYVITATATLRDNQVFSNTADYGGGLFLDYSNATLSDNTIASNTAIGGGGLSLSHSNATLSSNTVVSNTATDYGGGLSAYGSDATLISNTITSNTAQEGGGGLFLYESDATLNGNEVISNTARWGGGLYLDGGSDATLNGNTITSNNVANEGGGLYLGYSDVTLTNTVVADNQANTVGGGLYILASSPRLLHTTITRNSSGDGSGIYVNSVESYYSTVALTNTILVSHTVGISVTGGNTVTANGILWYSTPITISQAAEATVTVQNQYQGDPAFAADGYHLTAGSAAIDKGVEAGVTTDIDDESRPAGRYPDLGADEFPAALGMTKEADQTVVSGSDVTFTISLTNTGIVTLTNVIVTDTLTPDCARDDISNLAPTENISYTCVRLNATADFTNTATVTGTSLVGTVTYTDTALVDVISPTIEIVKSPDSQPVQSGDTVTFTITITNTGDAPLTPITVTDALAPDCEQTFTSLADGASESYTCTVTAVTADFTNTMIVTGTPPVGAGVTDADTALVYLITPTVEIAKTPDSQPVQSGDAVTFTISLTNTGDTTLTGVEVTDALAPDCERTFASLADGASESYTCTVAAVTADFTNTVIVTGTPPVGAVATDTDTALVYIIAPTIEIAKTPDSQVVQSGDTVPFTISLTNTGDITLTGVEVTDALVPDCERTFASLADGASESYTCTVTDVTADFTNTVIVTGTPPVGAVVADADTAFVEVINPAVEIVKSPDSQVVQSGDTVTFTITVTNTGDAALTGVEVTDAPVPDCARVIGDLDATEGTGYTCQVVNATASFTNTARATGTSLTGPVTDTDTATVTVEEVIEGLTADNDSPTPLGSATTLTATITDGSNVVYTWAFGHDGATGSGAVVTHIYPAVGVYTAVVTASNSVSMDTATTTVTITDAPIERLRATNDSPTPLGRATTLTATITDGSNVTYTWAFGHDGATGSGAVVAHTYPAIGTYTAVVTASNSVSVDTATTTVTIVEAPILNLYLPIILKNYTPPSVPPTETPTPTATGTLPPTATPTPTATPHPTGPDLVVTDISVVPSSPEAGQPATVYVTVMNQGNQPVAYGNNFYVDFYVDNVPGPGLVGDIQWGAQGSWFGVGESRALNGSYTFTAGDHQLYAQADTDNTVAETKENNNTYGPVSLTATSLEGGEAPVGPVAIPTPWGGSPRPTPTLEP